MLIRWHRQTFNYNRLPFDHMIQQFQNIANDIHIKWWWSCWFASYNRRCGWALGKAINEALGTRYKKRYSFSYLPMDESW